MRVGEKNAKGVWWNYEIKAAVRRKKAAWKGVLAANDEETKERCMEEFTEDRERGVTEGEHTINSQVDDEKFCHVY